MNKKLKYFFLVFCCLSQMAFSINTNDNKKTKKLKKEADALYEKKEYSKALTFYTKIYRIDSLNSELNYRIGICYYNSKETRIKSVKYFERSNNTDFPEASFYLGNLYHSLSRFNDAIKQFEIYKSFPQKKEADSTLVDLLISKAKTAEEMVKYPLNIIIHNMGNVINSPYPDYAPLLTVDESMIIFTSRRSNSTGGLKDLNGEYMEDVYISYKTKNEAWTTPVGISKNINTDFHDAGVALSPDGQQLVVYRTSDDMLSGDLYLSQFNGKDWSVPRIMGSNINVEDALEASATFSPDNNTLIFSSNRPGGYGGKDLYRVIKLPNREWSKAQNLGNIINTPYDEDGPFMPADGQTLYFSSKAHKNMGGYDVFKTRMNENGTWAEPENMGYPINTVNDDIFVFSINGNKAYFSSENTVTYGGTDVYYMDIPDQNFGLAILSCRTLGQDSSVVYANISIVDKDNEDFQGKYTSNIATGKFIMIINPERTYKITIQAEGYTTLTREIIFTAFDFQDNIKKLDFQLTKINSK